VKVVRETDDGVSASCGGRCRGNSGPGGALDVLAATGRASVGFLAERNEVKVVREPNGKTLAEGCECADKNTCACHRDCGCNTHGQCGCDGHNGCKGYR
jgi:hypothetical protein